MAPFPAPATSHVACGFPALRAYSWRIRELADERFPPSSERALWKRLHLRDAGTRRRLSCGYEFTTREQAMSSRRASSRRVVWFPNEFSDVVWIAVEFRLYYKPFARRPARLLSHIIFWRKHDDGSIFD